MSFKTLAGPHERFHCIAKEMVAAVNAGSTDKASKLFNELEIVSDGVQSGLDNIIVGAR